MINSPLLRMAVRKANEENVAGELLDADAVAIDYRAWDDAWYDVDLHLRGEVLIVEFCNLDPPVCERFTSRMFGDYAELELFRKKFRRNSSQLQDGECHRVRKGMMVCGSISSKEGDLRFYDAKVLEMSFGERKVTPYSEQFTDEIQPEIEFQSSEDDAWYSVRLRLDGESLIVSYVDFPNASVERFAAGSFQDSKTLEAFLERFRLASVQLQDGQCRKAIEGVTVCAAHRYGEDDVRFYDAVIDAVCPSEHKVVDGEEECLCKFVLFWQHGPNAGSTTCTGIANICMLRQGDAQIHPLLDAFVNISRKKIDQKMKSTNFLSVSSSRGVVSHGPLPAVVGEDLVCKSVTLSRSKFHHSTSCNDGGITMTRKDGDSYGRPLEMERVGNVGSEAEDIVSGPEMVTKWHYFIIDSLDPELSSADIVGFIYHHTSILCKVFLAPMFPIEYYARGIVFLEGEGNLGKLSSFLEDPSQIIMSSTGRPWLIVKHGCGTLDMICGRLGLNLEEINAEQQRRHLPKNLKVVREGTLEYAAGFKRKKLLIEFQHELEGLLKNLEDRLFGI